MRIPRWGVCLLGVGCFGLVGCSQTGWLRPKGPTDLKTEASINGRPVARAEGEPGWGTARHYEYDDPMPATAAGSRISGRVFDEEGRAVPNAKVRLGVGGIRSGRLPFATTDRSGAFTLHGLRPGRDYTVIAEYQSEDGIMTGQVQTRAPGTGVRIALGARDVAVEPRTTGLLSSRLRSGLFSDGRSSRSIPPERSRTAEPSGRAVDEYDREPTAIASASDARRSSRSSASRRGSDQDATTIRAGWILHRRSSADDAPRSRADRKDDSLDGPPGPDDRYDVDYEGENPLPPAMEPRDGRGRRGPARRPASRRAHDDEPDDPEYATAGRDARPFEPAPRPSNISRRDPRGTSSRYSRSRDAAPRTSFRDDLDRNDPDAESAPRTRSNRRPTWRELSIDPEDVPVDEALRRSGAGRDELDNREAVTRAYEPESRDEDPVDRLEPIPEDEPAGRSAVAGRQTIDHERDRPELAPVSPSRVKPRDDDRLDRFERIPDDEPAKAGRLTIDRDRRRPALAPEPARVKRTPVEPESEPDPIVSTEPVCRMDASHRRVVELRLPQLDGQLASLDEIDAEVILLDFWGSWCQECRPSIAHHRAIQKRLGRRGLQVVGIACEKGATFEARRDAAIAAARKAGINYPILVTSMDGSSPAQKALQVQFYPTMILLDRDGNILQFEQGATDATLARIDRAIERALLEHGHRNGD